MVIYPPFKTTLYCSMAAATRLRLKCQEHLKVKQTGVYALHFTLLYCWPFVFFWTVGFCCIDTFWWRYCAIISTLKKAALPPYNGKPTSPLRLLSWSLYTCIDCICSCVWQCRGNDLWYRMSRECWSHLKWGPRKAFAPSSSKSHFPLYK